MVGTLKLAKQRTIVVEFHHSKLTRRKALLLCCVFLFPLTVFRTTSYVCRFLAVLRLQYSLFTELYSLEHAS
jgi:hypothetical protein